MLRSGLHRITKRPSLLDASLPLPPVCGKATVAPAPSFSWMLAYYEWEL